MTAPTGSDTGDDAATTVQALKDQAGRLGLTWELQTATVTNGTDTQAVLVIIDGDTVTIPATSMIGRPATGARVYVITIPPAGKYVVGYAKDYALPSPTVTQANGTATSAATDTMDTVLGTYTATLLADHWYQARLDGMHGNASVAGDKYQITIKDGGTATPTAASTAVAVATWLAGQVGGLTGSSGRESIPVSNLFTATAGEHTFGVFAQRLNGTGVFTPVSAGAVDRQLYVVDMGPVLAT